MQVRAQTAVTAWHHNVEEPWAPSTEFGLDFQALPFNNFGMAQVVLERLTKVFQSPGGQSVRAVDNLSFVVADQELLVLVGPSGCGKTTTLRLIAGLEEPTMGTISINGQVVNDVPPKDRDIALVFQNYALYPHMSVYENMAFGLKLRHYSREEIQRRVKDASQFLDLTACLDRRPAALSGGQRQRVAIARALAVKPRVLLFDEPTSALDPEMTAEVLDMIRELGAEGQDLILVTHEMGFARVVADRVAFLAEGRILECGTADQVFNAPATESCRRFLAAVLKY